MLLGTLLGNQGRTKTSGIIRHVIAPVERVVLSSELKKAHISLIVDESTDKSWQKVLVLIAKYKDSKDIVREDFLGLLQVSEASSEGQKRLILGHLESLGIPLQNLMAIAFDNASVNTGHQKGLGVLLKEYVPDLLVIGCTSHSLALCSAYAAKKLPDGIDIFIRDVVAYVANSPKRQDELKIYQNFCHVENHKLLQTSSTRWLTLEASVERILEQWNPLLLFFTNHGEGDSAGDRGAKEKANKILAFMRDSSVKVT